MIQRHGSNPATCDSLGWGCSAPGFGHWSPTVSPLPTLTLSPDCPGKLRQVQEWSKVASAREIGKY